MATQGVASGFGMGDELELRLLGAPHAVIGSTVADIPPSLMQVLVRLAIAGSSGVESSVVADDLDLTSGALRVAISRLRKALPGAVVTEGSRYRLDVMTVEADRFEQAVADAEGCAPEDVVAEIDAALAMWRGSALEGLEHEPWARPKAVLLDELRAAARGMRIRAKLELGRHSEAIPDARTLVDEDPLRDESHALLMSALAGAGRRTEALRHFRTYRSFLIEEVGIEPGPEIRRVDADIAAARDGSSPETSTASATSSRTGGNLGATRFEVIGRSAELDDLAKRLDDQKLVTVLGPGGTGKTTVAIACARRLHERFADGVWIVEFGDLADEDGVPARIASLFDLRPDPSSTVREQVIEWLRDSDAMIVLDNCEHLLDAVASMAHDIVTACPQVRLLATSREPLRVESEFVRPLAPLSVEAVGDRPAAAVEMFESRGTAERGSWRPDASTRTDVEELCRRLDGIPLAIELAAARCRSMSVHDVLQRLDSRFDLLTGGRRSAAKRHQTLLATLEWSYQLLQPTERLVFDRLSVFSGRFGLHDATAICTDDTVDELTVIDALTNLVDKSMVDLQPEHRGGEYRLLETMKAYGAGHCGTELDDLRSRHCTHYTALAVRLQHEIVGPDEVSVRARARLAAADLKAALDWAAGEHDPTALSNLSRSMIWFVYFGWNDPARWVAAVPAESVGTIRGFTEAAAFADIFVHGDTERALGRLEPLQNDDPLDLEHHGLFTIFVASLLTGAPEQGLDATRRMADRSRHSDNPAERAFAAFGLVNAAGIVGQLDEETADLMLEAAERERCTTARSYALTSGSRLYADTDEDRQLVMLEEARDLALSVDSTDALANALLNLMSPTLERLSIDEAASEIGRTLEMMDRLGNMAVLSSALAMAQITCERSGHHELAAVVSGHLGDRRQPVGPADQRRYEESIALLEHAVDPTTLERLRRRGAGSSSREVARRVATMLLGDD